MAALYKRSRLENHARWVSCIESMVAKVFDWKESCTISSFDGRQAAHAVLVVPLQAPSAEDEREDDVEEILWEI